MTFDELWKQINETSGTAELQEFVASGGDLNAGDPKSGWTLLHVATEHQNIGLIQALVNSGADLNAKDHQGWTPLHLAVDIDIDSVVQSGDGSDKVDFPTTRALLSLGADATMQDVKGQTARDVAAGYSTMLALRFDRLTAGGADRPQAAGRLPKR